MIYNLNLQNSYNMVVKDLYNDKLIDMLVRMGKFYEFLFFDFLYVDNGF